LNGIWYLGRDQEMVTTSVKISMMRLKTGEMLIVAASRIGIKKALPTYHRRWGIETLFSCLKTRGLGLEDTHMTQPHKLATLMNILAIAFCLAYKAGLWLVRIKPPRYKAHVIRNYVEQGAPGPVYLNLPVGQIPVTFERATSVNDTVWFLAP